MDACVCVYSLLLSDLFITSRVLCHSRMRTTVSADCHCARAPFVTCEYSPLIPSIQIPLHILGDSELEYQPRTQVRADLSRLRSDLLGSHRGG